MQPLAFPQTPFKPLGNVWKRNENVMKNEDNFDEPLCGNGGATRAQGIWVLNLLCFIVHATWVGITSVAVATNTNATNTSFDIPIARVQTGWPLGSETSSTVASALTLRIDALTYAFFGLSALAHLFAVVAGAFERCIPIYWRFLDRGLLYWRWIEYSLSASIMIVAIGVILGVREEKVLILLFVSMATIQISGGLVTEFTNATSDNGERWSEPRYIKRMAPHLATLPLYVTCWGILVASFYQQIDDLKLANPDLADKMPDFVPVMIWGSVIIFSLFTFPQAIYMALSPTKYWQTEIWYCVLSLVSKVFLGSLLWINVLNAASFAEALARYE